MNSNNRNSMFPFRRSGGKKRGKPQGGQSGQGGRRQGGQPSGGGRRIPNSAAELLGTLQPTTKSLAQVLAGNTRASGQIVHARNILGQAERLVDERAVDRLPPKQREEFLEQLARLKLTLADADDAADAEAAAEPVAPAAPPMSMDRLRELALSIATGGATGGPSPGQPDDTSAVSEAEANGRADEAATIASPETADEPAPAEVEAAEVEAEESEAEAARKAARSKRGATLRLKTVRRDPAEESEARAASAEAAR